MQIGSEHEIKMEKILYIRPTRKWYTVCDSAAVRDFGLLLYLFSALNKSVEWPHIIKVKC